MLNRFLAKIADPENRGSFSRFFRAARTRLFLDFVKNNPKPIKIIDIGGTESFWETAGLAGNSEFQITVLNFFSFAPKYENIKSVRGDATDMKDIRDQEFDIAFSNSVIEHVSAAGEQEKMAAEIKRAAKSYFIQTPSFYFPLEPHFLFPFFQFFPLKLKIFLLQNFNLGWRKRQPDAAQARAEALSVKLLKEKELKALFPEGTIVKEKIFGLTKSYVVMKRYLG